MKGSLGSMNESGSLTDGNSCGARPRKDEKQASALPHSESAVP